jgi:hypothetical protein
MTTQDELSIFVKENCFQLEAELLNFKNAAYRLLQNFDDFILVDFAEKNAKIKSFYQFEKKYLIETIADVERKKYWKKLVKKDICTRNINNSGLNLLAVDNDKILSAPIQISKRELKRLYSKHRKILKNFQSGNVKDLFFLILAFFVNDDAFRIKKRIKVELAAQCHSCG